MAKQSPDLNAPHVAQKLQEWVQPAQVIFFGSRARGDWNDESDLDLIVLTETLSSEERQAHEKMAHRLAKDFHYPGMYPDPIHIHLFSMTLAEFNCFLTSPANAESIQRDGRTPQGTPLPTIEKNNPWAAEKIVLQIMPPQTIQICPIWDNTQVQLEVPVRPCNSPRAGGRFLLEQSGASLLDSLTDRQKTNLSYWIYHHNLRYHLFDEPSAWQGEPLILNHAWVEAHRDRTPLTSDCVLTFLREIIRQDDAIKPHESLGAEALREKIQEARNLQQAAGGCRNDRDWSALQWHATKQGWLQKQHLFSIDPREGGLRQLDISARIHVEKQLGIVGQSRQGFVAMWFDKSMDTAYTDGIKPACEAAGYESLRIDKKEHLNKVDDEIMVEIRRSRFVVADFTTSKEYGHCGGVYFEAGLARGERIPVIHTCHKDCMEDVHFDTNHFNHLIWETPDELREKLRNRIEATVGRGPLNRSNERDGGVAAR